MGCDIHCFAEQKINGVWSKVGKVFPNSYYDEKQESKVDEDGYEWNAKFIDQPYNGRNYDLFAVLADVRNGRGFAGIKTGEGFNPIADPKGLPEDVSEEIKEQSEDWGDDGHSHSFFTIKELKEYDWLQKTENFGVVAPEQYAIFKERGNPPVSYCGEVSGSMVKNVSNEEMDELIKNDSFGKGYSYYTQIKWGTTYKDAIGKFFFDKTIPNLEKLGNDEDVRIVFWFDN